MVLVLNRLAPRKAIVDLRQAPARLLNAARSRKARTVIADRRPDQASGIAAPRLEGRKATVDLMTVGPVIVDPAIALRVDRKTGGLAAIAALLILDAVSADRKVADSYRLCRLGIAMTRALSLTVARTIAQIADSD